MDEGILEVRELAGDRVVVLRVVDELRVVGLVTCEIGEIVRGDEGPVSGVAQVVCHGVKVVGVHGEEGQEEEGEVQGEVEGEVNQLRDNRAQTSRMLVYVVSLLSLSTLVMKMLLSSCNFAWPFLS